MKTIEETRACAKALTEHECAGPKTVFTNADGRTCIHAQCVFCLRRSTQALKACKTFGRAVDNPHDWMMDIPVSQLLDRWDRLLAFRALCEGKWPPPRFKSMGEDDPLDAFSREVRKANYAARLAHPSWKLLRLRAIERAGGNCELCHAPGPLDVHHLTYIRFWHERPEDVAAICRACHQDKIHERKFGGAA